MAIDITQYGEKPYSQSDSIKPMKGWRFYLDKEWYFDIDISPFFSCSTNWCCGSVIASGFELFIEFGPIRIERLNRMVIEPPKGFYK